MAEGTGQTAALAAEPIDEPWELPPNWKWKRLGDVLPLAYGKALPESRRDHAGNIPVYGSSGVVGSHTKALTDAPTILVGRKGSAGSVHLSPKPCWPIDTVYYAVSNSDIDLRYAFYLLRYLRLGQLDQSTAIPSLSRDVYSELLVPVPPIDVQCRIAGEIDRLFGEIDEGESALADTRAGLDTYRKSLLNAAFAGDLTVKWREKHPPRQMGRENLVFILEDRKTIWERDYSNRRYIDPVPPDSNVLPDLPNGWVWASLQQFAFISGGITVDQKRRPENPVEVSYLRVANVQRGYIDLEHVKTINVSEDEIASLALKSGDILLNEGGDRDKVGRGWVWEGQLSTCIHQNHVFKARPATQRILPKLVSLYLNELGREFFLKKGKQTTNLASISLSNVARAPVPIPPLEEAKVILNIIEGAFLDVEEQTEMLLSARDAVATCRQSILAAGFRGDLVQ